MVVHMEVGQMVVETFGLVAFVHMEVVALLEVVENLTFDLDNYLVEVDKSLKAVYYKYLGFASLNFINKKYNLI
jgi:hypothetical protein